jgi:hypothetical protein
MQHFPNHALRQHNRLIFRLLFTNAANYVCLAKSTSVLAKKIFSIKIHSIFFICAFSDQSGNKNETIALKIKLTDEKQTSGRIQIY